ncbi:methyl-accepting chemotaxis protein, partial [Bacillus velezensis]|nr:methyl-accepting chemotaxis protein [Bacillus velezensis]
TMEDIVTQVKRVSDLIAEISSSTAEQSTGVAQVDQAVVHLDNITQQNAALVEQAAAAAASLEEQTRQMKAIVSGWRVAGGIVLAPARSVARPVAHEPAALPSGARHDAPVAALPAPQAAVQPAARRAA